MDFAVGEAQRHREIVGDRLFAQFGEERKIHRAFRVGEPAADGFAGGLDTHDWTGQIGAFVDKLEWRFGDFDLCARPPEKPAPHYLRMERAHKHGDPPQRKAVVDQARAEFGEHIPRVRSRARAVDQPSGCRADVEGVRGGETHGRSVRCRRGVQRAAGTQISLHHAYQEVSTRSTASGSRTITVSGVRAARSGLRRFCSGHGRGLRACQKTSALSVIASKVKQSRLGLRICGLVWIASLSLAMTSSTALFTDGS